MQHSVDGPWEAIRPESGAHHASNKMLHRSVTDQRVAQVEEFAEWVEAN